MKGKTIGIVGGGQLGKMLTDSAHKLGFKVVVLDPTPNSPASLVADKQIIGDFKNKKDILKLGKLCDFITFEIESANPEGLKELIKKGKIVHPSPEVLKIINDKFRQKIFLNENDIPVAPFAIIESEIDCENQAKIFGYPFLLKARFGAYDGRGNFLIKSKKDINRGFKKLSGSILYAEKFVPFVKELSVVCTRNKKGEIITFPVVETIHKNNICHIVRSPAPISSKIEKKAETIAKEIINKLKGVGTFAFEMFLTKKGEIFINEIAPRVHNSGHHSIEAFNMSQFEAHIRAVTGMPFMKLKSNSKSSVMHNILGDRRGKAFHSQNHKIKTGPLEYVHIYGKLETRKERKMGHITVLGNSLKQAESKAKNLRKRIKI